MRDPDGGTKKTITTFTGSFCWLSVAFASVVDTFDMTNLLESRLTRKAVTQRDMMIFCARNLNCRDVLAYPLKVIKSTCRAQTNIARSTR
jgi:hypothetical protein